MRDTQKELIKNFYFEWKTFLWNYFLVCRVVGEQKSKINENYYHTFFCEYLFLPNSCYNKKRKSIKICFLYEIIILTGLKVWGRGQS